MRRHPSAFLVLALALVQALALVPGRAMAQGVDEDANTYESPTFGYTLSWGEAWSVEEEFSENDFDFLQLGTSRSTLYLEGQENFEGEVDACLENALGNITGEPDIDNVEPLEGEDGKPVAGAEEGRAYAAYTYEVPQEDAEPLAGAAYLECRTLIPGTAALEITFATGRDSYEDEQPLAQEVLDTLVIPVPAEGEDSDPGETDADADAGEEDEDEGDTTVNDDASTSDDGDTADDEASAEELIELMQESAADIDEYWSATFEASGLDYESPTVEYYDDTIETGCGTVEPLGTGPHYCPPDRAIYMDVPFMEDYVVSDYGEFSAAFVVAHEWGHHIQELLDVRSCQIQECLVGSTSLEIELQADCMAGSWTRYADDEGSLRFGDTESAVVVLAQLVGDPEGTAVDDPAVHGPGSLRAYWFLNGYYNGVEICLSDGRL